MDRKLTYRESGVDIKAADSIKKRIGELVKGTFTNSTISEFGLFGGIYQLPSGKGRTVIASTDGVGTKLFVAQRMKRFDTVGVDIVNHCINDIIVHGAEPLFFLDYLGIHSPEEFVVDIVKGLCSACKKAGIPLIGGETAVMPEMYSEGKFDLVGTIVGILREKDIITGKSIKPGDIIIGLPSSGLHTNGYTLARKALFEKGKMKIDDTLPSLEKSIGEELLTPHTSYLKPVQKAKQRCKIHGMAHITGGGIKGNLVRILPEGTSAVIYRKNWRVPTIFNIIQKTGGIDTEEMYNVFNMGIGYLFIVPPQEFDKLKLSIASAGLKGIVIGKIISGERDVDFE
ncbi:MAG: phosphoribosylformylglycinamidine cyclo-ligase [candidate division Zixibacteria bacterium 4484_93]|nr:MAG: phosphoribosylformylglycinamidine cyclo-ligase [candidate division Zixibacteria bacterium 4484_93]RKZ34654.1 MAG: phosphoribosylformylglycinamidine cyclo-ligase [bacterium]